MVMVYWKDAYPFYNDVNPNNAALEVKDVLKSNTPVIGVDPKTTLQFFVNIYEKEQAFIRWRNDNRENPRKSGRAYYGKYLGCSPFTRDLIANGKCRELYAGSCPSAMAINKIVASIAEAQNAPLYSSSLARLLSKTESPSVMPSDTLGEVLEHFVRDQQYQRSS